MKSDSSPANSTPVGPPPTTRTLSILSLSDAVLHIAKDNRDCLNLWLVMQQNGDLILYLHEAVVIALGAQTDSSTHDIDRKPSRMRACRFQLRI